MKALLVALALCTLGVPAHADKYVFIQSYIDNEGKPHHNGGVVKDKKDCEARLDKWLRAKLTKELLDDVTAIGGACLHVFKDASAPS